MSKNVNNVSKDPPIVKFKAQFGQGKNNLTDNFCLAYKIIFYSISIQKSYQFNKGIFKINLVRPPVSFSVKDNQRSCDLLTLKEKFYRVV